ncbi:hypothetical protein AVEN_98459-1 [Araneus ventricosus]|uniref:DUF5641 domain-containing protein n=1 Tax=Araneus ventricosus TaxID=182803 RepID=A0A4Y2RY57_ARAVE|nr:hypothetical protein AVEN_98459-1 [Araneus ventricosus]
MNIADLLSRGCTPQQMLNSKWWEGPSWLKENPESWPVSDIICQPKEVDIEKRKSQLVNMNLTEDTHPWYAERVSDYDKMIRVFTWILRFVNNCKLVNGKCKDSELSQSEIEYSEKKLIRLVQSYYFSDAKSSNFIETFLHNEGILRVKTKIINRNDDRSFLYPILLPEKCEFTKLLIRTVHRKNCHAGIHMMQCLLRESMFLIENRSSNTGDIEQLNSSSLNKRIKYRSKLLKDLRQRFRKEYLGQLVQKHNEKHSRNPQIGEIVLVGDDNKKRLFWVLAKIIELIPGRDGKIRTVKLKTQHGTVLRPIQRIYPLEIYSNQSVDKEPGAEESNSHDVFDNKNKLLPGADDVIMRKYTSSGRYVKAPKRLDLLNNVCYVLETLSESQWGGEDVVK